MGNLQITTGQKFAGLTVFGSDVKRKTGKTVYAVGCECGKSIGLSEGQLRKRVSCGCKKYGRFVGQTFGYLKVTGTQHEEDMKYDGPQLYRGLCSCGNKVILSKAQFKDGRTRCGWYCNDRAWDKSERELAADYIPDECDELKEYSEDLYRPYKRKGRNA